MDSSYLLINSNKCLEKEAMQSLLNCLQSLHGEGRLPKPSHESKASQ